MKAAYVKEIPPFKPQFLRDLLAILGKPSSVRFIIRGKEISEAAKKIGKKEGLKLDDRYVGGAPVELDGEASPERIAEIYEQEYQLGRKQEEIIRKGKEFDRGEKKIPRVGIEEIHWYKWRDAKSEGYRIRFDRTSLEIDIDPREEKIIRDIVETAKKHNIEIHISLKQ